MNSHGEKVQSRDEVIEPKLDKKGSDYLKIWKSWGMTEEQWQVVEAKRVEETKVKGAQYGGYWRSRNE